MSSMVDDLKERSRVYTTADAPDHWREQIEALADAVEALERVMRASDTGGSLWGDALRLQGRCMHRLVWQLGACGLLDGAVQYDECGRAGDIILWVERDPDDDDWVRTERSGGCYLAELANNCSLEQYIGLPGTKAYGVEAVVELARERAA